MAIARPGPDMRRSTGAMVGPPRYQPVVIVAVALAGGMVFDRHGMILPDSLAGLELGGAAFWWLASAGLWFTWLALCVARRDRLAATILLVSIAAAGAAWHHLCWNNFGEHEIGRFAGDVAAPVCLEAQALASPERIAAPPETPWRAIPEADRSRLRVRVLSIRDGTSWRTVSGIAELTVEGHLLGVRAGDRLRVFGQLRRIAAPANPGAFDFAADARAERRLASLSTGTPSAIGLLHATSAGALARRVDRARDGADELITRYVRGRPALASTLLLGKRSALDDDVIERYRVTGTIHVLVVSGLHVGIVVAGLYGLKRSGQVPRAAAVFSILALVLVYCLLSGANPPVVRASVMAVLVCLAGWTGRYAVAMNSLAAAAVVVLAINPCDLFRVGTQLSFLAVGTLIQFGWFWHLRYGRVDPLQRLIEQSRPWPIRAARTLWRWNFALLMATCAVWLVALPLVMNRMHLLTPAAVATSPLLWPLVTGALWGGVGVLVSSQLVPPLAMVCGMLCDVCLAGLDHLIELGSRMPWGYFWVAGPADWWVMGFYLAVIVFFCTSGRILAARWWVGLGAAWIIAGAVPAICAQVWHDEQLECSFLAMGHGCSVVIVGPDGRTILYDAGSLGSPDFATEAVAGFLWERGIGRIDALVLSHADLDHYSAVPGLCDRFAIGAVYVSPVMFERFGDAADDRSAPQMLRRTLEERDIAIHEIYGGDRLRVGPLAIEVLHPPPSGMVASDNADSVTLNIEFAGRRVLLPGDLEGPGLEALLAELPLDTDILLAPHHGSRRSDPPGLAAWATPEFVVISGAGGADAEGVAATYTSAGARVVRTDLVGAIRFRVDSQGGISLSTWHGKPHAW